MKIIKFAPLLLFLIIFCLPFLSTKTIVAHDFPLLFRESRDYLPFWSLAWDFMGNGGIGGSALKTMWIDLYANFVYFISNSLGIPWWLSQRIFWLLPFVVFSLVSSYKFSGIFIKDNLFRNLSSIIYTFNTYILLIVGGGQFGIAFAYSIAPLVLLGLLNLFNENKRINLIKSSFLSGLIIALDPRVALLTFLIAFLYFLFFIKKFNLRKIIFIFINFLIAGILNSYWIFPALMSFISGSSSSFVSSYSAVAGVKFLSFATLENTISFLHPNWPENIFGKIYFQKPEFLVLPVLAFGALIFKIKKEILFLVVIALIGVFFGKGASEPFGNIYLFLFEYLPGFSLFRDSTKFYLLIAISFSILIPYFLNGVSEKFEKLKYIIAGSFIIFLFIILKPLWSGELSGIFRPTDIPKEYVFLNSELKNFNETTSEYSFSRILWVPKRQKYGYFDPTIPSIDSEVLFKGKDIGKITEEELVKYSVGLVVVPTDPDGEIFLKDRKYSETERRKVINKVEKIDYLQRTSSDEGIKTYLTYSQRDLFWWPEIEDLNRWFLLSWEMINPTKYNLKVEEARKEDLIVFSQSYDSGWVARGDGFEIKSEPYEKNLNSFRLPKDGNYSLEIYYKPQDYVSIGLIISLLSVVLLCAISLANLAKRARK